MSYICYGPSLRELRDDAAHVFHPHVLEVGQLEPRADPDELRLGALLTLHLWTRHNMGAGASHTVLGRLKRTAYSLMHVPLALRSPRVPGSPVRASHYTRACSGLCGRSGHLNTGLDSQRGAQQAVLVLRRRDKGRSPLPRVGGLRRTSHRRSVQHDSEGNGAQHDAGLSGAPHLCVTTSHLLPEDYTHCR